LETIQANAQLGGKYVSRFTNRQSIQADLAQIEITLQAEIERTGMEKFDPLLNIDPVSMVLPSPVAILVISEDMPFVTALIASAKDHQEDIGDAQKFPLRSKPSIGELGQFCEFLR
jgi:hypothetical protein